MIHAVIILYFADKLANIHIWYTYETINLNRLNHRPKRISLLVDINDD